MQHQIKFGKHFLVRLIGKCLKFSYPWTQFLFPLSSAEKQYTHLHAELFPFVSSQNFAVIASICVWEHERDTQ